MCRLPSPRIVTMEAAEQTVPETSAVLPILAGAESAACQRLIKQIQGQTYGDLEIIVVGDVTPNGRARNEGVKHAKGKYLFFADEGCHLAHERVIEQLIEALKSGMSKRIAMVGVTVQTLPSVSWLQKQYSVCRAFETPDPGSAPGRGVVQHLCMAMDRGVYEEVGWESDALITGTDDDLRQRVAAAGYGMTVVPETLVYYEPPHSLGKIIGKSYRKGLGSAVAFLRLPGLFPMVRILRVEIRSPVLVLLYKWVSTVLKVFHPKYIVNPVTLLCEWGILAGFTVGWFRWIGAAPIPGRKDLPNPPAKS